MGAAEHQGVDAGIPHRFQVLAGNSLELRAVRHAVFDELDEAWARLGGDLQMRRSGERVLVRLRQHRRPGADDTHMSVTGSSHSAPDRRLDHLDDGDPVALTGVAQHGAAGRVAGDDQQLHPLVDELVHHLQGEGADFGKRARTVRAARGVTDITDRLVRQLVQNTACDSEPAHAAVEDPDRCVVHGPTSVRQAHRSTAVSDSPSCRRTSGRVSLMIARNCAGGSWPRSMASSSRAIS